MRLSPLSISSNTSRVGGVYPGPPSTCRGTMVNAATDAAVLMRSRLVMFDFPVSLLFFIFEFLHLNQNVNPGAIVLEGLTPMGGSIYRT